MNDKNIRELALEAAQGSASAFEQLYLLTRQGAWFVALSITKNEQDAQDIIQESYLKAFKSVGQLTQPESFAPWLHQIVANKAKNYIARKRPDSFADYGDENALDWQEETDPAFLPDENLDREEAKALIAALVKELPEDQRLVVLLRYYDDLEVAAIANSLEIPEGTVKSRLARARAKLAAMLRQAQDKGLKLYSLAPVPLLAYFIKLLGFDAPGSDRLPPLLIGSAAAGTAAAGGAAAAGKAAAAGAAEAAKKAPLAAGQIAALAAAAVVVVGGIAAAGVFASHRTPSAADTAQPTEAATEVSQSQAPKLLPAWEFPEAAAPQATQPVTQTQREPSGADSTRPSSAPSATVAGTSETQAPTTATGAVTTTQAAVTTRAPFTIPQFTMPDFSMPRFSWPWLTAAATTTATTTTTGTTESATDTTKPSVPEKEYEYTTDTGGIVTITKYVGTQSRITVPAQIDGKTVRHLGDAAFKDTGLTHVVLSSGIDCIRSRTFADCPGLEEIVVPSTMRNIWPDAFEGSPNLVIICEEGTQAHTQVVSMGIPWRAAP